MNLSAMKRFNGISVFSRPPPPLFFSQNNTNRELYIGNTSPDMTDIVLKDFLSNTMEKVSHFLEQKKEGGGRAGGALVCCFLVV